MTISAKNLRFDDATMWVELSDGRVIGILLAWFPRLLNASEQARSSYELSKRGIHWDCLDEDISVAGLLAGRAAAEETRIDQRIIMADPDAYQEFLTRLDQAPSPNSALRKTMQISGPWEQKK